MLWSILLLAAAEAVEKQQQQNRKLAKAWARKRARQQRSFLRAKTTLNCRHQLRQKSQKRRHMRELEEHRFQKNRNLEEAELLRKKGHHREYASLLMMHLEGNHRRLMILLDRHGTERRLQKEQLFEEKLELLNLQQQQMRELQLQEKQQ